MTVKELIEQLSKFDPETEVLGMCTDPTDYTYKSPIESIELGDPYDTNGYSGVDDEELDYSKCYEEDEETGEETYVGPKVVLLNIGDV
jgi:hypothetical protein